MTNKHIERLLKEAGFWILRNGNKHAIWTNGRERITVAHGKMSAGAIKIVERTLKRIMERRTS